MREGIVQAKIAWKPPKRGWIKLNTDAAAKKDKLRAGWGIATRGERGEIITCWARPERGCAEPVVEEAKAIRYALCKAKETGWRKYQSNCNF